MEEKQLMYAQLVMRAQIRRLNWEIKERKEALTYIGSGISDAKTIVTRRLREFERELVLAKQTLESLKEVNK